MGANNKNDMSKAINERRTKDKNAFIWYAVQTLLYPILVISFLICEEAGKRVGGILIAFFYYGFYWLDQHIELLII